MCYMYCEISAIRDFYNKKHIYNLPVSARIAIFAQKIGLKLADINSV